MDIATIIGIIAGFGLILLSILLGGDLGIFINIPSIIIVFGGTVASTLINYPMSDVLSVIGPVKNAFFNVDKNPAELINKIIEFATIARREGILALEGQAGDAGDEFLGNSIQLAIDGTAPELIKDILTTEVAFMEDRHAKGQAVLSSAGPLRLRSA